MPPQSSPPLAINQALALLEWQIEMGADEAIGDTVIDRLASPAPVALEQKPAPTPAPRAAASRPAASFATPTTAAPPRALTESAAEPVQSARALAAQATTIEALAALVAGFDACPLKRTATNTVFADGNPAAPVIPLSTVSQGQAAISLIDSGPASTLGSRPLPGPEPAEAARPAAARSARVTASTAPSCATATASTPNSTAWLASRSRFPPPAARAVTRNLPGLRRMTSAAWVPMDPVEPRIAISRALDSMGPFFPIPPATWTRPADCIM